MSQKFRILGNQRIRAISPKSTALHPHCHPTEQESASQMQVTSDIENRLLVSKGEGGGEGMEWEFGINRCKVLYIERIKKKVLLYSTGNYIQYPVIMEKNIKKYIFV